MYILKSLYRIVGNIRNTILRFPVPLLSAIVAFAFFFAENHQLFRSQYLIRNHNHIAIGMEALSGIALFLSFDLFILSKKAEMAKRIGLYLLGFCILGMHFYSITPGMFDHESIVFSRYLLFSIIYHLMVSISTYHLRSEIESFWQFNYFLFIQFVRTLAFSLSLFIGLSSAIWAIDNLFGMGFSEKLYIDIGLIIFIVFNTLFFLNGLPHDFAQFKQELVYKKPIKSFIQYVLLPITLLYMIILYLYFFKILMEQRFPNGWICVPILIFSILGIFTYLLIYPIREAKSNKLFYNYGRYFFYSLLPLLTLYFISIIQRIKPYGITEDRYLIFILGLWLLIISVYIILSKKDNIIIIPVSLWGLMTLSVMGPWGMFQLSGRNQLLRLGKILKRNEILVGNKLMHNSKWKVSPEDAQSIQSILRYLQKRGELNRLHPWLVGKDKDILEEAIRKNEIYTLGVMFNSNRIIDDFENQRHYTLLTNPPYFKGNFTKVDFQGELLQFSAGYEATNYDTLFNTTIQNETIFYLLSSKDTLFNLDLRPFVHSRLREQNTRDSIALSKQNPENSVSFTENYRELEFNPDSMKLITINGMIIFLNRIQLTKVDTLIRINEIEGTIYKKSILP